MTLNQFKNMKIGPYGYIAIGTIAALAFGAFAAPYFRKKSQAQLTTGTETPLEKKFAQGDRDTVEEASWESFPASDPPAW